MIYRRCGKRAFDLAVSVILLVLLSPLLVAVAVSVAVFLGRPVLFRQSRPGQGGILFRLVKFRSMSDKADSSGNPLPDEERLGRFGKFLRASSLDELPELWNVLRGEMSLVGPRPLLPRYVERYTPFQARRMEVKPGITGWAQVNGRNLVDWEERFSMDVWYVENRSFGLDLKILGLTMIQVFRREGISAEGHSTMAEFMGSRERQGEDASPGVKNPDRES